MLKAFNKYITNHQLFTAKDRILLAVSGGVDSVILCVLMKQAEYNFGIAHCNFQLRGKDSDGDAEFVKQVANFLEVPFYDKEFATEEIAKERKESIQIAARNLRYDWFQELVKAEKYDYIATAHHLNDSIETVLFNLARGTGIRGMHGILPKKNNLVRPLLFARKEEILNYANEMGLTWREDASNASDKYMRNYLRHNIIPHFEHLNPHFIHSAATTIPRLYDAEQLVDFALEVIKQDIYTQRGKSVFIDFAKLQKVPAPRSVLFELVKDFGFNGAQIAQLFQSDFSQSGNLFYSNTHKMLLGRTQVIVKPLQSDEAQSFIIESEASEVETNSGVVVISERIAVPEDFPRDRNVTYLAVEKLVFPLTLRHWQQGDIFQPLGMKGRHRKLSDFMTDNKLSRFEKEEVWILENGDGKICWIVGLRADERFRIEKNMKACLRLEWRP